MKRETGVAIAARLLVFLAMLIALPFAGAGRLDWWRGWAFAGLFFTMMVVNVTLVASKNPELMRERWRRREDTKTFDKVFAALNFPTFMAILFVGGYDGSRHPLAFQWFVVGVLLMVLGDVPVLWAMLVNVYLETTVRIQKDRGHKVVTTGPYALVRHPMYTGMSLTFLGLPLILGSAWAYVPAVFAIALLVWRTWMEDRTLRRELEGYEEFTQKTRYRLIPGIW